TRSDLKALAACIRGSRQTLGRAEVRAIRMPTLVAVGTADEVAGSAQELAALLPAAEPLDIPGRDHMQAVGDKVFKAGVLAFVAVRPLWRSRPRPLTNQDYISHDPEPLC